MNFPLWIIPFLPLAAAVIIAFFGKKWLHEASHWPCILGIGGSCVCSLAMMFTFPKETVTLVYPWIHAGDFKIDILFRYDNLTGIMLATVTFVSTLVAIYASGYMHGDRGYPRFFAAISLFVFSMTSLVLAGNFLLLFVFWEAVGLCSYLLIGFWFQKPSAAEAAKKAFLVNRIGDFGFILGLFLIYTHFGSLNFQDTIFNPEKIKEVNAASPGILTLICLLLFTGAAGKSAQFPLHVWLPDAMEGPTPVSALIHAATMVTAGVYMVARCTPFFIMAPEAQLVVAGAGGITAILGGMIAMSQYDLKRVLAYSTISQLGYMFLALGSAAGDEHLMTFAVTAAIFHLFTHAFFKALLFLGAGSVMHAMGNVIDMREFSGLRKVMPTTHWTFLVGSLALAGCPLLAGFWSKEEVLAALFSGSQHGPYAGYFGMLFAVAVFTALLTAFYTFRAYFMTFWGETKIPHAAGHHAHESPANMTIPLVILAFFSIFIGLIVGPTHLFAKAVALAPGLPAAPEHHGSIVVMLASLTVFTIGVGSAAIIYLGIPSVTKNIAGGLKSWHDLSWNKFYIDEIYSATIVRPIEWISNFSYRLDARGLDQLVDLAGYSWYRVAGGLRGVQNGFVQSYALVTVVGLVAAFFAVLWSMKT